MNQEINENVSVLALFEKGAIKPCSVTWQNREYQVTKLNSRWRQKVGATYHIHLSVSIGADMSMELVIDTSDLSWRLARVDLAG